MCVYTASKSRDDNDHVIDAIQRDLSRSNSLQQLDAKSSRSVTSSPSIASSSSSSSSSPQRHSAAHDDQPRPRHSPQQTPTGSDVTGQPGMTSSPTERGAVEETLQRTAAGPPVRRRAVDLSDLRSCALVQTQLKTRKASTSWRYDNSVFVCVCVPHAAKRFIPARAMLALQALY